MLQVGQVVAQTKPVMTEGLVCVKRVIHYPIVLVWRALRDTIKTLLEMGHVQDVPPGHTAVLVQHHVQNAQRENTVRLELPLARTVRRENTVRQGLPLARTVRQENIVRLELPLARTVLRGHIAEQELPLARTVQREKQVVLGLPLVRIVMRVPDATVLEKHCMPMDRAHVFNVQSIRIVVPPNVQNQL